MVTNFDSKIFGFLQIILRIRYWLLTLKANFGLKGKYQLDLLEEKLKFWHHSLSSNKICDIIHEDNKREVVYASYSMLRGFLNALEANDQVNLDFFV